MDDSCAVCADTLEWVAYGGCGHRDVCSTCVARLRFICLDRRCCICKTENNVVFVTKVYLKENPMESLKQSTVKAEKGDKAANGAKVSVVKEALPLELRVEQELPKNAKCLMDSEAAHVLEGIQEQMALLLADPTIKIPV